MILEVTDAIRNGELVFATLGYPVKAGVRFHITDEQFYANDIQIATRKGLLKVVNEQGHKNSPFAKRLLVRNLTGKPLAFDTVSLLAGEEKMVSDREATSKNMLSLVKAGWVEIEDPEGESAPVRKGKTSKKGKTTKTKIVHAKTKSVKVVKEATAEDILEDSRPQPIFVDEEDQEQEDPRESKKMKQLISEEKSRQTKTSLQAWNPHTKKMMGKDEASRKVAKIISSRVEAESDTDLQPEPTRAKKVMSPQKGKGKRSGLTPVGSVRPEPSAFDEGAEDIIGEAEISFVDREQNIQRLRSRPDILARKQNREIE